MINENRLYWDHAGKYVYLFECLLPTTDLARCSQYSFTDKTKANIKKLIQKTIFIAKHLPPFCTVICLCFSQFSLVVLCVDKT